jgi:pyruvate dehydrogenase E2 component (dihydrolipoamide acetyltransferase)
MDVRLPNLGEGADSGSVVSLAVKEGEVIKKGQTILELENEKAVAPIPSPADGKVVNIRVKAGDKLTVGQVILSLESEGAAKEAEGDHAPAEPPPAKESEKDTQGEAPQEKGDLKAPPAGVPPPASPSIRKMARELGLDLTKVRGSEAGGRIVLADLKAYIQRLQQLAFPARSAKQPTPAPAAEQIDFSKWGPIRKEAMSSLRRTISQRMQMAWTTIPHVTQFDEADITRLTEIRKHHASSYEAKGARLTLTCFALKAVVQVLKKYPIFNSSLDDVSQEIVYKDYFHVGLAVDTEAGLIVPVIRDVDKKNLFTLARELHELAEKARERKVALDDLKGGTFTISNQGGIGGAHFTPIVNKPEVAILGLGRGALKPAVRNKQIEQRLLLPVCLSYDHRVIDGGQAARFITELLQAFENFNAEEVKL